MTRKTNLLALLGAAAVTVLAVAGFSNAASSSAPANTAVPKITGTAAEEDQTLAVSSGTWTSASSLTYDYQWRRCDAQGNGCSNISGADSATYQLQSGDVGHTVRVRVTATNSDGSTTADSDATAVIRAKAAPPPTTVNGCPTSGSGTLSVTSIAPPARLVIDGQTVSPTVITRAANDVTLRFHVSACSGRSVSGALVYATAVPFSQFSIPPEAQTGSDGWVTLTMHQARFFPASPRQQLLARVRAGSEVGRVGARRCLDPPPRLVPRSPLEARSVRAARSGGAHGELSQAWTSEPPSTR